jgi:hypothetical protein
MTSDDARKEHAMRWYNKREQIESKAHELFTPFLLEKGFVQRKEIRDVFGTSLRYAAKQIGIRVRESHAPTSGIPHSTVPTICICNMPSVSACADRIARTSSPKALMAVGAMRSRAKPLIECSAST